MKWDGATTAVFRKSSSALSLRLHSFETIGSTSAFPKYILRKYSNIVSSYTNVNRPLRIIGDRSSMVISRSTTVGSWILPIRVATNPLMAITYFSNLPEDPHRQHTTTTTTATSSRSSDHDIHYEIGKQNLAELDSTASSCNYGAISSEVTSWAEQYISNALQGKRHQITEKSLGALQILIRSCDSSTTKKHFLDLVLRFLLYPDSTTTTTTVEEHSDNPTMATNLTNPLDVILKEISIIATNIDAAPYYAETILDYMEKKGTGDSSGYFMTPTVATYNFVIEAWKNRCTTSSSNSTTNDRETTTFSSSKNKSIDVVVLRAQAIYDRMVARNIQPNTFTLTLLIHLWAASYRNDAAYRATVHLCTLENQVFQQGQEIRVDTIPTNENTSSTLSSIGNGNIQETKDGNNYISIAPQVNNKYDGKHDIQQIFSISVKEYEAVLRAWAVSKGKRKASPKRSAMLLKEMTNLHTRGMLHFEPSIECYKAVLTAWKACDGKDRYQAAEEAMGIISSMLERYDDRKEQQRKQQIPIHTQVLPPDSECFTIALSIMSRSSKRGMAAKSQYFLQRMEQLAAATSGCSTALQKRPTWVNYTDVIKSFALSKDDDDKAMNAEKVLLRMEQLHDEYGDASIRPHVQSYIAAMSAHIKSNEPDKAKQTLFLLQHMDERNRANASNPKPTTECYNTVLMACARPPKDAEMSHKQVAFRVALSMMKVLMKPQPNAINSNGNNNISSVSLTCNEETFELLFRCCAKLLPWNVSSDDKTRVNTIRFIFQQACRYGCVNEKVLKELNAAAGSVLYQRLVGTEYTTSDDVMELVPKSWSRNLKTETTARGINNSKNVSEEVTHNNGTSYEAVPETLLLRKNRKILQGGRFA